MNARLHGLQQAGVSIWLDTLSRDLLESGEFARLIADSAVTGATSNPTIFAKAITSSTRYDAQLRDAAAAGIDSTQAMFFELPLDDVRGAADLLRPIHDASQGRDGFVSFECTPDLADDTAATIAQASELWRRLARPNVLIKVPATQAGLPAIEALTAAGVNVNVTLAVLRRPLRAGARRLLRGPRTTRRQRAARRGDRVGRVVLRFSRRQQGRPPAAGRIGPARPDRRRQRPPRVRPLPQAFR
jgi:transaldolase